MCQLGRSWVFVALATESVDWVRNESKVSLFTVPVFFYLEMSIVLMYLST